MKNGKFTPDKQRPGKKVVNIRFDPEDFAIIQRAAVEGAALSVEGFIRYAAIRMARIEETRIRVQQAHSDLEMARMQLEAEVLRARADKIAETMEIQVETQPPVEDG